MADSDIFWLIILAELGAVATARGLAQLLAAGALAGTIYIGNEKKIL